MVQRLARDDLVLVTGANGFLAGHIADALLERGFRVRGTVRRDFSRLSAYFEKTYGVGRFAEFKLPDLADLELCGQAVDGVAGILHVAGDTTGSTDWEDVVNTAVKGSTTILRAAAAAKTVRSVVVTSTVCAAELPRHNSPHIEVSKSTWNLKAFQSLKDHTCSEEDRPTIVYAAAKTEAERACWDLMEKEKPSFVLNTVLPCYITGPPIIPGDPPASTMAIAAMLLENNPLAMQLFPPEWHVDVRDTALLHIAALLEPDVKSERLFGCAQSFRWTDVLKLMQELRPGTALPDPPPNEPHDGISYTRAQQKSKELVQRYTTRSDWISLRDSIAAGIGA